MTQRLTDELFAVYKERTHSDAHYFTHTNIHPTRHDLLDARHTSTGLIDSRSGSLAGGTVRSSRSNRYSTNHRPSHGALKGTVRGGRGERAPSPAELAEADPKYMVNRVSPCWICGTRCEARMWPDAPDLYTFKSPSPPTRQGRNLFYPKDNTHRESLTCLETGLLLCTRCSAACALPEEESIACLMKHAKLRNGGRTEPFVTNVRNYKRLLELLAEEVREIMKHSDCQDGREENMREHDRKTHQNNMLLSEYPVDVQYAVLRKLVEALNAALNANTFAERHHSQRVMRIDERRMLEAEFVFLKRITSERSLTQSPLLDRRRVGLARLTERSLQLRKAEETADPTETEETLPKNANRNAFDPPIPPPTRSEDAMETFSDNILMHYFEGRLRDLPPFHLVEMNPLASTDAAPQHTWTEPKKEFALMSSPLCDRSVLARLEAEERRRVEAETALRHTHQRLTQLEKATDEMAELVLTHRMRATVAAHLDNMQRFLVTSAERRAAFTLQKSLLFAEEMAELVRQTQRDVYGIPQHFTCHARWKENDEGKMQDGEKGLWFAKREDNTGKGESEMMEHAAVAMQSLFPMSLDLKPLV